MPAFFIGNAEHKGRPTRFPYSSGIRGSKLNHMRELRMQHEGRPYRVLYAFDPAQTAFLLVGGDKTGSSRWYETSIPQAETIYIKHLKEMNSGNYLFRASTKEMNPCLPSGRI